MYLVVETTRYVFEVENGCCGFIIYVSKIPNRFFGNLLGYIEEGLCFVMILDNQYRKSITLMEPASSRSLRSEI
jgi:hypothetical protein